MPFARVSEFLNHLETDDDTDLNMKVRELIKLLESKQWRQVRQKGSHRAFRHPLKALVVTVPGNRNDDVPIGTLKSILRKAEIEAP
jgi:predicted RNA binding protein YcfA (HicA-like mRNA interferase family)